MQQVSVRRWLDSDSVADRFRSFWHRAFLSFFSSSLVGESGPGGLGYLAGLALICSATLLSGCGAIAGNVFVVSPGALNFGTVSVGQSSSGSVTLTNTGDSAIQVLQLNVTGGSFSLVGSALPITIAGKSSTTVQVQFSPASTGAATGQLTVDANVSSGTSATVQLSGTGTQGSSATALGVVSGLSCATQSVTGSGTDTCTVTLSAAAGSSGLSVNLSSSSTAVTVPSSVTVPANATSATFSAAIAAVATAQTATLTANSNGANVSTSLQLKAATNVLSVGATTVAFGTVAVNTAAQQTITLASTGTQPVTISSATLSGAGFSSTGPALPVTLNPGQVISLTVTFDPAAVGAATGQLTITSNSTTGSSVVVGLTGTGASGTGYAVNLTWNAPGSSGDPVAGYNVYRSTGGAGFAVLNGVVNTPTTFTDSQVQSGASYVYYVTSVDANGAESAPSNNWSVTIP